MVVNLATQAGIMHLYTDRYAMLFSMLVGTGVGLIAKYILDKRYIFAFKSKNLAHNTQLFFLYCIMGVLTTALFWILEYGFEWFFSSQTMRYIGGAAGLILGYLIKYSLDKKILFVSADTKKHKINEVLF